MLTDFGFNVIDFMCVYLVVMDMYLVTLFAGGIKYTLL